MTDSLQIYRLIPQGQMATADCNVPIYLQGEVVVRADSAVDARCVAEAAWAEFKGDRPVVGNGDGSVQTSAFQDENLYKVHLDDNSVHDVVGPRAVIKNAISIPILELEQPPRVAFT